jgi:hypothetical protein
MTGRNGSGGLVARIRTIKPDFFTSEDIVSLSPLARLLYIALWCEADREGRFTWRPATFKLRYFPGDRVNIESLGKELTRRELVIRYGCFAYIPSFLSHQHPNLREKPSSLPDPSTCVHVKESEPSVKESEPHVGREGKEGKGREGNTEDGSRKNGAHHVLPDDSPIIETLPLREGGEFPIRQSLVKELEPLYPAVDLTATLKEMKGWLLLNKDRRKTRAGVRRFIGNWLQSEQAKHGG